VTTVRIGLTGPIGCGKSTIAGWLAEAGAVVVDADDVARRVTDRGGQVFAAVVERFGAGVVAPDGSLDRVALARIVFTDPVALADLERIVHPAVRPLILEAIGRAERDGAPAVVVEAIKLVESGLASLLDEVWLVTCAPATQRARLTERGMDPTEADRRMGAQAGAFSGREQDVTRILRTDGPPGVARAAAQEALAVALNRDV
jgi:dephospho-CoA kinase